MVSLMFDIGIAAFAFLAAGCWFSSAGKPPPMLAYWDGVPDDDPYRVSVERSARMNRLGAVFAGFSAAASGVKVVLQMAGYA